MTEDQSAQGRPRVLVARRVPPNVAARAREMFDAIVTEADMDADTALRVIREERIAGLFSGPKVKFTAAHAAAMPDGLKVIANPGAGYDHMDVEAARARGIVVTNAPDVVTDCTADLALMLILNASRRAREYDQVMREGWRRPYGMPDLLGLRPSGRRRRLL